MADTRPAGGVWRGTSPGDKLAAVGCLVLLVSLFLTWMGGSFVYTTCDPSVSNCTVPGGNKNGFTGIGLLVGLVLLLTIALLAMRSPLLRNVVSVRQPAWGEGVALLGAGAVIVACVLVYYLEFHAVGGGATRSPKLGFFGAIVAGLLIAGGGFVGYRKASRGALQGGSSAARAGGPPLGHDPYAAGPGGAPGWGAGAGPGQQFVDPYAGAAGPAPGEAGGGGYPPQTPPPPPPPSQEGGW